MALTTLVTNTGDAKADTASRYEEIVIFPTKFQISEYAGTFSKDRAITDVNPVRYEGTIIEYQLVDPFTVNLMCAVPFTDEEEGVINVGEVYIIAQDSSESGEFLLSVSQPATGSAIVKTPSNILLMDIVINTPGVPIISSYSFTHVTHPGNVCTAQKLKDLLADGQGITTTVTAEGKLRIDADFDYIGGS